MFDVLLNSIGFQNNTSNVNARDIQIKDSGRPNEATDKDVVGFQCCCIPHDSAVQQRETTSIGIENVVVGSNARQVTARSTENGDGRVEIGAWTARTCKEGRTVAFGLVPNARARK